MLPDPADPDVLARFRATGRGTSGGPLGDEVAAAMRRRSDRRPFAAQELSADVVEAVQAAAAGPGARVDFPKREDERIDLAVAVSWADRVQRDDEAGFGPVVGAQGSVSNQRGGGGPAPRRRCDAQWMPMTTLTPR